MNNKLYIEYNQIDTTALADADESTTDNSIFGNLALLKDKAEPLKYMTIEEDFTLLDGSFEEMPDSPSDVVFFSSESSDMDGYFTTNPTITVDFDDNHSSVGITLYFSEDYPLELKIRWYNGSSQLISEQTFEPNSLTYACLKKVDNYQKIEIEFTKALPYHFIKLWYIEYGREFRFGEDLITSAKMTRSTDSIADKIAIDTMSVEVTDKNNDFNLANPDGQHTLFQRNQKLIPYRIKDGVTSKIGEFYLKDYKTENNIAKLSCISEIGIMDNFSFTDGAIYQDELAGTILEDIFATCGITDYVIDSVTYNTELCGTIGKVTCRKALREVLFACGSIASTVGGGVAIKKQSKTAMSTVTRERKFSTKQTKNEYISDISISYSNYVLNTDNVEILSGSYAAGTHFIEFSEPVANLTVDVGTITSQSTYNCSLTLTSDSDIVITGNKYDKQDIITTYSDDNVPAGENRKTKDFKCTLYDCTNATDKARDILEYYQMALSIDTRFVNDTENSGSFAIIENPSSQYGNFVAGFEKVNTNLIGFVSTCKMRGYYQTFTENNYCGEFYCGEWGLI